MTKKMKIAVVGPGGVGGYFGGLLAKAGLDVHFLGRGAHLEAIRKKGLEIRSCNGDFTVKVKAYSDPVEIGPCDLILFCVKAFDTKGTVERIKPLIDPSTIVLSLQNGVDNEASIGDVLGKEKVMGGIAFIGSRISEPGVILHTAAGSIAFGEIDGGESERGRSLLRLLEEAGIEAKLTENIKKTMWRKMVWNCGFNAITALTGCTVAQVLSCPESRSLIKAAMGEVIEVAISAGIGLAADIPEKTITQTEKQGEIRTSMLIDMERGRPMEIEALNGAVSRAGREFGVATPVNDTLYGLVTAVNRPRGGVGGYSALMSAKSS